MSVPEAPDKVQSDTEDEAELTEGSPSTTATVSTPRPPVGLYVIALGKYETDGRLGVSAVGRVIAYYPEVRPQGELWVRDFRNDIVRVRPHDEPYDGDPDFDTVNPVFYYVSFTDFERELDSWYANELRRRGTRQDGLFR